MSAPPEPWPPLEQETPSIHLGQEFLHPTENMILFLFQGLREQGELAREGGPESRAGQSGAVTGAGWLPEVRPVQQGLPGTAVSPEAEGTAQSSLGRVILSVTFVVSRE